MTPIIASAESDKPREPAHTRVTDKPRLNPEFRTEEHYFHEPGVPDGWEVLEQDVMTWLDDKCWPRGVIRRTLRRKS